MTFEKAYGKWLVDGLNEKLIPTFGIRCKQYNELAFKALNKNPDEVAIILNGGGAARSAVREQDQNSGTFSVAILCQKKYMEDVRSAVEIFQKEYNAEPIEMNYADENGDLLQIHAKSVFFTPTVADAQDYPTEEHGTLKVVFMLFSITVLYGSTAVVSPADFKLSVNGVSYPIDHIYAYDNASIPTYDTYLAQGEDRNRQIPLIRNNSWAITVYKTSAANELQRMFQNEIDALNDGLWGKELALIKDGKTIEIRTYQLTASYVDNAAAYVLTVMC